jgi:hypothetical protein
MKRSQFDQSDWKDITTDEAYRLDNAKFQGMTIQALQDLRNDIDELKTQNNNKNIISYTISLVIGAVAGIFGGQIPKQ